MNWYNKHKVAQSSIRIWLDDERPMPSQYNTYCKTAEEAISYLRQGNVEAISLDHDLGPPQAGTGYDVARFLEEAAATGQLETFPEVSIHSANPIGRQNMYRAVQNAMRYWEQTQ